MSANDEQQIRNVIDTWMQASREDDLDTVLGLMTEDVVFLTPGNPPMRRKDFAAASKRMIGKVRIDGVSEIQEITVTGDLAFCWNRLEITATSSENSAKMHHSGNTLSVFRRCEDGQWRLWRDANLLGPATQA
ncbi:MAG TPA: SgcJ/EcaC family oxidoreductase [Edaphobacter sp.]|jgi:uncharacterized protein (TIGR02246 family)|nr:SgcJ/EcaC family oxidoreductase [Edaphobacter sp.]